MEVNYVGSIEYNMEGMEKFLPNTHEFFYVHWYQELGTFQADITICLENEETGEIRELWYKRVDENTEDEVENEEFEKFFNEHFLSLKGRKYANDVLCSSLIAERWIPDAKHRKEHLALYRRVEKHSIRKIAMAVLMLEDCNVGGLRELWHTRVKLSDKLTEGRYKERLEKIMEEHYVALIGRGCFILTVTPISKNSEWMEMDVQKPGADNEGMRGIRIVDKWSSTDKS
jgi:hypothetical protein